MQSIVIILLIFLTASIASAASDARDRQLTPMAGHSSVFTTNTLSFKQAVDQVTGLRLISIGTDGLVSIKRADGSVLTARAGKPFRNQYGHATDIELLSVNEAMDKIVIRSEMRVYHR
jgi:hypothetical protein